MVIVIRWRRRESPGSSDVEMCNAVFGYGLDSMSGLDLGMFEGIENGFFFSIR